MPLLKRGVPSGTNRRGPQSAHPHSSIRMASTGKGAPEGEGQRGYRFWVIFMCPWVPQPPKLGRMAFHPGRPQSKHSNSSTANASAGLAGRPSTFKHPHCAHRRPHAGILAQAPKNRPPEHAQNKVPRVSARGGDSQRGGRGGTPSKHPPPHWSPSTGLAQCRQHRNPKS